jgi:hypothetical protein
VLLRVLDGTVVRAALRIIRDRRVGLVHLDSGNIYSTRGNKNVGGRLGFGGVAHVECYGHVLLGR